MVKMMTMMKMMTMVTIMLMMTLMKNIVALRGKDEVWLLRGQFVQERRFWLKGDTTNLGFLVSLLKCYHNNHRQHHQLSHFQDSLSQSITQGNLNQSVAIIVINVIIVIIVINVTNVIIVIILRAILAGPSLVSSPVCPSCLAPLHPPLLPCTKYYHCHHSTIIVL